METFVIYNLQLPPNASFVSSGTFGLHIYLYFIALKDSELLVHIFYKRG